MRPPAHWFNAPDAPGLTARLLQPVGALYAMGTALRLRAAGYGPRVPVVCIGNLNAGGTGKTPTAIALAERLAARGVAVQIVSRGHGGALAGPVQVDPRKHSAGDVGDEPLLLAAFAPTWVAKDRAAGVQMAEAAGADIILLDDGFQNPSVEKAASILVVDAAVGFGNGLCIPAGPLREPVAKGLARASVLLSIGDATAQDTFRARWGHAIAIPLVTATLRALPMGMPWTGSRVLAFAGIGRPEKFFATLRAEGADVVRAEALDDHQPLTEALMRRMEIEAAALGAQLVTTEKDAVRLPASFRAKVLTLPVRLHVADWTAIDAVLPKQGA
ncbi:MAG: tetraacyldisaccharide 4'-kinase [Paracoccaceae bacterium]